MDEDQVEYPIFMCENGKHVVIATWVLGINTYSCDRCLAQIARKGLKKQYSGANISISPILAY